MSKSRQLVAIMFTDIVGYTSLMGNNERKAFEILSQNRQIQKPIIEQFNGRWIKELGDGVMASFNSVSDAVHAAIKIQQASNTAGTFQLRIGIHLGEVVFENEDVFGDGVNIASRIQALASPGSIWVSEAVHNNVVNKDEIVTEFVKVEHLKNVKEPIRIYQVNAEGVESSKPVQTSVKEKNVSPYSQSKVKSIISIGAVALIGITLIGYLLIPKWTANNMGSPVNNSIAVLPFTDMSPEKDQEYLGDGIAEEIINVLTKIDGLKVIGRTSSFSFKEQALDLKSIGAKLDVSTILEGSIRKSNNKIRIRAQLINSEDGTNLWSQTFDSDLDDIFAIQDEISAKVVEKFKLTLSLLQQEDPPTRNIEAYELYLKGKYYAAKGLIGTKQAKDFFKQAIELDQQFVNAYIQLSRIYTDLGIYDLENRTDSYSQAVMSALKSIEFDPNSPEAYSQLSMVNAICEFNWNAALRNHNRAVELSKGMPLNDSNYAHLLAILYGSSKESIQEVNRLLENDPYSIELMADLTRMCLWARQYEKVIEVGKKTLVLSPDNTSIKRHMGSAYYFLGEYKMALEIFEELYLIKSTYTPHEYVATLVKLNRLDEARALFNDLKKSIPAAKTAMCYIYLNETDSAFHYLDKAYEEKDIYITFIKSEAFMDPIKDDPRFQSLLQKMNFPK